MNARVKTLNLRAILLPRYKVTWDLTPRLCVPLTVLRVPVLSTSALVLDESCVISGDLACHVMGKVKDIESIPNLRTLLSKEGFLKVKLSYLGGLWIMIELENEASKRSLLDHVGVKSWFHIMQEATQDFVSEERVVWVDIKGVPLNMWSRETTGLHFVSEVHKDGGREDDTIANDVEKEKTPSVHANVMNTNIEVTESSIGESNSIHSGPVHNGGSILDVLEDMVRVGHSMGYNLEGCMKDMESIIGVQGVKEVFK
ncbi:hypothetical protein Tco_1041797 [Tanacetum coccineum]|uniref:DUF4283 domain-containing protein n=1 Tax=Tanacetum coccineum TaxID=301880 RepID=A0ABQ5GJF6_9ASTR